MFAIRRRTLYLLITVSLGHVLLISVQVQSKSGLPLIEAVPFSVFAAVQRVTGSVSGGLGNLWRHYLALGGVARENEALRRQMADLEGALLAERAVASQARDLEDALNLQKSLAVGTLAARVIAGDPASDALTLTVTIDRGSADGVAADMAVMAAQGVVGRVINRPAPHASQVQLLVSRTAAAGAVIERADAGGGIVVGTAGDPPLQMRYLSDVREVHPGDRVVTSGQDGVFPRGFLIGWVARAEGGGGRDRVVTVRPAVDFTRLNIVLVVLARPSAAAAPGGRGGA
jgi:rod shape-determining protein MreC